MEESLVKISLRKKIYNFSEQRKEVMIPTQEKGTQPRLMFDFTFDQFLHF